MAPKLLKYSEEVTPKRILFQMGFFPVSKDHKVKYHLTKDKILSRIISSWESKTSHKLFIQSNTVGTQVLKLFRILKNQTQYNKILSLQHKDYLYAEKNKH